MHCGSCGINLEIDFDPDEDMICAQCKSQTKGRVDCEFFEIVDWDESTNEIIHAVCTMPSPCWPNCNQCQHKEEYQDVEEETGNVPGDTVRMMRWIMGKQYTLTQGDIDVLDGSRSRKVRIDTMEDAEIKHLYDMWKQL